MELRAQPHNPKMSQSSTPQTWRPAFRFPSQAEVQWHRLFQLGQRQASSSRSSGPVSETGQTRKVWQHGVAGSSVWQTFRDAEIKWTGVATQNRTTTWCTLAADLNIYLNTGFEELLWVTYYKCDYATILSSHVRSTGQNISSKLCVECLCKHSSFWTSVQKRHLAHQNASPLPYAAYSNSLGSIWIRERGASVIWRATRPWFLLFL